MSGNSNVVVNSDTVKLATSVIPPKQLSFREVNSQTDP